MCPCASREQPKTTPLAVVTGPEVLPPSGGLVSQSQLTGCSVEAPTRRHWSRPPAPQGLLLLFALAV